MTSIKPMNIIVAKSKYYKYDSVYKSCIVVKLVAEKSDRYTYQGIFGFLKVTCRLRISTFEMAMS